MCLRLKWKMKSTYVSCPAYKNVNAKSIICFTAVVDDFFCVDIQFEFEIADAFFRFSLLQIFISHSTKYTNLTVYVSLSLTRLLSLCTFCYVGGDP